MTEHPSLGPETGQHNPTCNAITGGPVAAPTALCGLPATVHMLIDQDDNNVLACDAHAPLATRVFDVIDAHPAAHICVMPGALWSVEERRCRIDGLDLTFPDLVAAEGVPAGINSSAPVLTMQCPPYRKDER